MAGEIAALQKPAEGLLLKAADGAGIAAESLPVALQQSRGQYHAGNADAGREAFKLKGLSEYYMERQEECPENSVILGYASLQDGDIPALAAALKQAWGGQDG